MFVIDDSDDSDDLADMAPTASDPAPDTLACSIEQRQCLLPAMDTAERVVGTAGCCGALVLLFGCLCCGQCEREFVDTYRHHTLCGRWCPV
jgi:hypothetical protein